MRNNDGDLSDEYEVTLGSHGKYVFPEVCAACKKKLDKSEMKTVRYYAYAYDTDEAGHHWLSPPHLWIFIKSRVAVDVPFCFPCKKKKTRARLMETLVVGVLIAICLTFAFWISNISGLQGRFSIRFAGIVVFFPYVIWKVYFQRKHIEVERVGGKVTFEFRCRKYGRLFKRLNPLKRETP